MVDKKLRRQNNNNTEQDASVHWKLLSMGKELSNFYFYT